MFAKLLRTLTLAAHFRSFSKSQCKLGAPPKGPTHRAPEDSSGNAREPAGRSLDPAPPTPAPVRPAHSRRRRTRGSGGPRAGNSKCTRRRVARRGEAISVWHVCVRGYVHEPYLRSGKSGSLGVRLRRILAIDGRASPRQG